MKPRPAATVQILISRSLLMTAMLFSVYVLVREQQSVRLPS